MTIRLPKRPRHHKAKELAYCRLGGKMVYLGAWPRRLKQPPPAVEAEFKKKVAEFIDAHPEATQARPVAAQHGANGNANGNGRRAVPSVHEVWQRYHAHCQQHYRKEGDDGIRKMTTEVGNIVRACRIAAQLYGNLPAERFGAAELLEVRAAMIGKGWVRDQVNIAVSRVRAMFNWAARVDGGGKLIPMAIYWELMEVRGLEEGRCDAPEGDGQSPVDMALVEKTLPFCSPIVRVMVKLHYHMGCRSQDLVAMKPVHIDRGHDTSGKGFWLYRSPVKKTRHKDKKGSKKKRDAQKLVYWIKPDAQALLLPLIIKAGGFDSERHVFTTGGIRGVRSDSRGHYDTASYRLHVKRACDRLYPAPPPLGRRLIHVAHGIKPQRETDEQRLARLTEDQREQLRAWQKAHGWTPYQLRHSRLTDIHRAALRAGHHGAQAAQKIAQHEKLDTTLIYVEENVAEAHFIMERFG